MEKYYLIRTYPDNDIKLYIYWKTSEIIIWCQLFFVAYIILTIILGVTSKSVYYWIFYSVIPIIHFISTLMTLFKRSIWSTQDIRNILHFNCGDMFSAVTSSKTNFRPFTTFISTLILLLFYSIFILMKPVNQWIDLTWSPTNSSSCTTESLRNTGNPYNPLGFFSYNLNYSDQIMLKMCPMDQTYAYPNLATYIVGYEASPLATNGYGACSNPLPPFTNPININRVRGYADTSICLNKTTGDYASYTSPVLGINPPITSGTINPQMFLCKGNTDSNVCVSSDGKTAWDSGRCPNLYRTGKPKKICPTCLNYWRWMSGDINGPPGYSHCTPYSSSYFSSWFCAFCPGRGYGVFKDEIYTQSQVEINVILGSVISFLLLFEYILCIFLVSKFIPDIKDNHHFNQNE